MMENGKLGLNMEVDFGGGLKVNNIIIYKND